MRQFLDFFVAEAPKRVNIITQWACEEARVLWNESYLVSQQLEVQIGYIYAIN